MSSKERSHIIDASIDIQHCGASPTPSQIVNNDNSIKELIDLVHESGEEEIKRDIKGVGEKPSNSKEDGEVDILMQADELQRWKHYLWLQIIQHNKETIQELLDSASQTINGLNTPIRESGQTILNTAIGKGLESQLVQKLVNSISPDELLMKDQLGRTALHQAIRSCNISIAYLLIDKVPELVNIKDKDGRLPVDLAAINQQRELTFSLHEITRAKQQFYLDTESGALLSALSAELYDLVLYILKGDPELEPGAIKPLLQYFVDEPRAFLSRTPLNKLQSLIYSSISVKTTEVMDSFELTKLINTGILSPDNGRYSPELLAPVVLPVRKETKKIWGVLLQIYKVPKKVWEKIVQPIDDLRKAKIRHLLAIEILRNVCWRMSYIWHNDESPLKPLFLLAAENGIHEMVEAILDAFPQAIKLHNEDGHSALHIAAMYRHEKIFSIALQKSTPEIFNLIDKKREVLIFRVAHNALQSRLDTGAGVVFRMQRELRWYKELEKIVPDQRKSKNEEGKTPVEVFKETHQDLVGYENKWMLEMANSCIVGGSLIVTIGFAAAITVPGGNRETGLPTFLNEKAYRVFAFSNALSLIFSITSVLIFLSIFTSRHSIKDYFYSLPNRMIFGLIFLFLSVTSLMVDFTAIMYIVSGPSNRKDAFTIAVISCIPIGFFTYLQLPSLINMIASTYFHHPFQVSSQEADDAPLRSPV